MDLTTHGDLGGLQDLLSRKIRVRGAPRKGVAVETVVRTEDLPVGDRFAFWLDMITQTIAPYKVLSDHAADFRATVRMVNLGGVQVALLRHPSLEGHRSPKLIRQSDPEYYQLALNLHGHVEIIQGGRSVTLGRGDLTLHDTSRPFRSRTTMDAGHGSGIVALIPRTLLPLPENTVKELLTARLSGRDGIGAVVTSYLQELIRNAGRYRPTDAPRLAAITVDMVTAMVAHELDILATLPPETHQRALFAQIQAFIEQHLGHPGLGPETIATAHHISTRTLHRLFHAQNITVVGWIRIRRLECARRDLADPLLRTRPIRVVAARWGFTSNAHFSRLFRAAYGTSPKTYRAHHHPPPDRPA